MSLGKIQFVNEHETLRDIDTQNLVEQAALGDTAALQQLFEEYRSRLKRMISCRMDPRMYSRLDESDVVQEALVVAAEKLGEYTSQGTISFYPWLRRIAWERLIQLHRHHISHQRRSLKREVKIDLELSNHSAVQLVDQLVASSTGPGDKLLQREQRELTRLALRELPPEFREVLILRYLEELTVKETAEVLGVPQGTVKSRHFRAISLLYDQLQSED